jgi:uncharacterized membrane protein SpoIIM required for sporulation
MTEKHFIDQNIEKWRELEELLQYSDSNPERLHSLFVEVSSDLSYVRTYFPSRSVRVYLNGLTQKVFDRIKKSKKRFDLNVILDFFAHVLPREIYKQRKYFIISFLVFSLAVFIGAYSTSHDAEFLAMIVGEDYVAQTNENINQGDPMKIYKDHEQVDMFFGITLNNIRVSFTVFVLGLLGGIGSIFVLAYNGIMLGAFQYYFYTKGLFVTSFLTIWIHGTIEISAIIIAGAAGLVLGKGVLFPGTYHRSSALQISALSALRILLGTVPLFIIAGMLESFVTRYTEMPTWLKIFIIVGSLLFILFMWVWYPYAYNKKNLGAITKDDFMPAPDEELDRERIKYRNFEEHFILSLSDYKNQIVNLLRTVILPFLILAALSLWVIVTKKVEEVTYFIGDLDVFDSSHLFSNAILVIGFAILMGRVTYRYVKEHSTFSQHLWKYGWLYILVSCFLVLPFVMFESNYLVLVFMMIIPPHFLVRIIKLFVIDKGDSHQTIRSLYTSSYQYLISYGADYLLTFVFYLLLYLLLVLGLGSLFYELLVWHKLFISIQASNSFFNATMIIFILAVVFPFFMVFVFNKETSLICRDTGLDLEKRLIDFGKGSTILEI